MISVCSSVYKNPDAVEVFVRSVLGNASKPEEIELIIVNDGDDEATQERLEELNEPYPQIRIIQRSKENRIKFFEYVAKFYETNVIFPPEHIKGIWEQIERYRNNEIDWIWYNPGHNYNIASSYARGDYLYLGPADYVFCGDLSRIYEVAKDMAKEMKFCSRFDWIDFTSLPSQPDMVSDLRRNHAPETTRGYLKEAADNNLLRLVHQHGVRLASKNLFDDIHGFDDRWCIRAITEDLFNLGADVNSSFHFHILHYPIFEPLNPIVGPISRNVMTRYNYLIPTYDGQPDSHDPLKEDIKFFIYNQRGKYAGET